VVQIFISRLLTPFSNLAMKLLLISRDFPNIFGGVSDYTYHLSKALAEKGHEVYVLTSDDERVIGAKDGGLKESEINSNLNSYSSACVSKQGGFVKIFPVIDRWSFSRLFQIVREIRKINPDRVMLQYVPHMYSYYGTPLYIGLLSILLCLMRFKLITTFHELGTGFEFKKPRYWGVSALQKLTAYFVCIASDKIVVSIEADRKILWGFRNKVHRIPIGSNILPIYVSDNEKEGLRAKIANSKEIIISTFGSNPRRNDVLVRIIKRLKDENIPSKLLIIGKFPDKWIEAIKVKAKELEISDAIYFTGFIKSEDVYRHLSISDIFIILEEIYPGGWGGVSTKSTSLASAFAAGLPAIGSKGGMTDEDFFIHEDNIALVDSLDEEVISKEIKKLIANPIFMENLKTGAARTFEMKLSWSIIAKRYMEVF
jgi:glycosyltransferase involved in cell wall biosynthesis